MKDIISLEKCAISAQIQLQGVTEGNCTDPPCSQQDCLMDKNVDVLSGHLKSIKKKIWVNNRLWPSQGMKLNRDGKKQNKNKTKQVRWKLQAQDNAAA